VRPETVEAFTVLDPAMFPKKFEAETFPDVFMRSGETYVFAPIDKRYWGFVFEIPTFPKVTKELKGFVNWTVFEVVFPLFTTASRVVAIEDVVMELSLPFESMVNCGTCELDPYVPGFTLVVQFNPEPFPKKVFAVTLPNTRTSRLFEVSGTSKVPDGDPNVYPNVRVFIYADPSSVERYAIMTFPAGLDKRAPSVVKAGAEFPIWIIESLNMTLFEAYVFPVTYKSPPTTRLPAKVRFL
jgi:hypothetical protein